jgi:anti-anti-sigma regulatory factor
MSEKDPLTIESAAAYKKLYADLCAKNKSAVIDLGDIPAIDLSGIQILVAAIREAIVMNREIHFSGVLTENFSAGIRLAGITDQTCTSGEDLENLIKAVFKV